MTEKNNNWPRKHHGEHNSAGRTGNTNFDTPGLKKVEKMILMQKLPLVERTLITIYSAESQIYSSIEMKVEILRNRKRRTTVRLCGIPLFLCLN